MKRVAVVLAGCGVYDGSEIHEAVLTLLALDQRGIGYQCFAPDIEQMHVVNHLSGEVAEGESRNVLVEAARIARGNIKPLAEARGEDFDALVVPGGFGAAKNLSDFAVAGAAMAVQPELLALGRAMRAADKAVALICIAPVMAAAICGEGSRCTIGSDADTAAAIEAMGGEHLGCPVTEARVDRQRKLVTTPAYMLDVSIAEVQRGIDNSIAELAELMAL